jgi:hypothetical protein
VRETAGAGEATCRRCWVATATVPDMRRLTGKQIAKEAGRKGEADYHRRTLAVVMDRRRRPGVVDHCRRQMATGQSVDVKLPRRVRGLG